MLALFACADVEAAAARPRLDSLQFQGPAPLRYAAEAIIRVAFEVDPSLAANAGLFDDATTLPSFAPRRVGAQLRALHHASGALRDLPWGALSVDEQIDARWLVAWAETLERQLSVERVHTRRPGQWLEPVANTLLAMHTYAPERTDLMERIHQRLPGMLDEIDHDCTAPTARDIATGVELATSLRQLALNAKERDALDAWVSRQRALVPSREFDVIGAENYAWRFEHSLLFPFTPAELLARAEAALAENDTQLALAANFPPAAPVTIPGGLAAGLDQAGLERLYDAVSEAHRQATLEAGFVSVPTGVGPVRTRATPDVLIPFTGDGGSMNPPPAYHPSDVSYWNVEHARADWSPEHRDGVVQNLLAFRDNGMGTYAAHEGWPGHHLQLSIARLHDDPVRTLLPDGPLVEGWALYAEEVLADHGGMGRSREARMAVANSQRGRIRRVFYDVNVESGRWTLDEAAAWKLGREDVEPDPDILRAINWPTQLVGYFAGKAQIVDLREAMRAKLGNAYDERAFHDALLAEGLVPISLVRAKLLNEPVGNP